MLVFSRWTDRSAYLKASWRQRLRRQQLPDCVKLRAAVPSGLQHCCISFNVLALCLAHDATALKSGGHTLGKC